MAIGLHLLATLIRLHLLTTLTRLHLLALLLAKLTKELQAWQQVYTYSAHLLGAQKALLTTHY